MIKYCNPVSYSVEKEMLIELRRQQWTTAQNLNLWFDSWCKFLVEKGFASIDAPLNQIKEGEVYVSPQQKRRVINLDETAISLDGSDGAVGGRPAKSVIISGIARAGTAVNKSGGKETLVCGSNAAGEAIPPIFILSSSAQEENRAVRLSWVSGLPKVTGLFGHKNMTVHSTIIMVNEKGGQMPMSSTEC